MRDLIKSPFFPSANYINMWRNYNNFAEGFNAHLANLQIWFCRRFLCTTGSSCDWGLFLLWIETLVRIPLETLIMNAFMEKSHLLNTPGVSICETLVTDVHCAQASLGHKYQMFLFCYSLVLSPNSYVNRRLCGTAGSPAISGILHVSWFCWHLNLFSSTYLSSLRRDETQESKCHQAT